MDDHVKCSHIQDPRNSKKMYFHLNLTPTSIFSLPAFFYYYFLREKYKISDTARDMKRALPDTTIRV